jgi:glutamine---fructose-6-phosphate transaminase (isomerizing)
LSTFARHNMFSYVMESGSSLERTLREADPAIRQVAAEARGRGCRRLVLTGVGSSYTAAVAAKPAFDNLVDIPAYVIPATELSYYPSLLKPETLVLLLSRSGERKLLVDALALAQGSGALTVLLTGNGDSLMAQQATRVIVTSEGPEASFPKTKSVTAGIGAFLALSLDLASPPSQDSVRAGAALERSPALVNDALQMALPVIEAQGPKFFSCDRVIVTGTAGNAGVAMEMQVKLEESALVATQWMDTGNLLHGPLCLLDDNWLVIFLVTERDLALSADAILLVKSLGGKTLGLVPPHLSDAVVPDYSIPVPASPHQLTDALIYLPVLQLLAYEWTVFKGLNPDSPPGSDVMMQSMLPEGRLEAEAYLA